MGTGEQQQMQMLSESVEDLDHDSSSDTPLNSSAPLHKVSHFKLLQADFFCLFLNTQLTHCSQQYQASVQRISTL